MKKIMIALAIASASAAQASTVLLSEGFDNIATLAGAGWTTVNNSSPLGTTGWFQGDTGVMSAASGAPDSYIAANFLNTDGIVGGNLSNWLITPTLSLQNGEVLTFLVRVAGGGFTDTLEARLSTAGSSSNVGALATSVGDFTTLLGTYSSSNDDGWVTETFTIGGLGSPTTGRFGFRYVGDTTLVDPNGMPINGNYIGVDSVNVSINGGAVPEPASLALAALALGGLAFSRRQRQASSAS